MNENGKQYRTTWTKEDDRHLVQIIDQRHLPFDIVIEELSNVDESSPRDQGDARWRRRSIRRDS